MSEQQPAYGAPKTPQEHNAAIIEEIRAGLGTIAEKGERLAPSNTAHHRAAIVTSAYYLLELLNQIKIT